MAVMRRRATRRKMTKRKVTGVRRRRKVAKRKASAPRRRKAARRKTAAAKSSDMQVVVGRRVVGSLRTKANSMGWKPRGARRWYSMRIDKVAKYIMTNGKAAKR